MLDPYVYEGTDVLANKFGIEDANELGELERLLSLHVISELLQEEPPRDFGFAFVEALHQRLFEDIYPFAGKVRTIAVWKPEIVLSGRTVDYAAPSEIRASAEAALAKLGQGDWTGMDRRSSWESLASSVAGVWKAHPFREGNSRAVLMFIESFARAKGFPLDMAVISRSPSETRDTFVLASEGDVEPLANLLIEARSSHVRKQHPVLGQLSTEAAEVLRIMKGAPISKAETGQTVRGTVLCTSYGTTLVRSHGGIVGVPVGSFDSPPPNDRRVNVVVKADVACGRAIDAEPKSRLSM